MKKQYLLLLLFAGIFVFAACNKEEACVTTDMTYNNDIASILNASCAFSGCHVDGSTSTFSLGNYAAVSGAIPFGRMLGAINHETGFTPMPFPPGSDKIDDCDINKITAWIADGYPE